MPDTGGMGDMRRRRGGHRRWAATVLLGVAALSVSCSGSDGPAAPTATALPAPSVTVGVALPERVHKVADIPVPEVAEINRWLGPEESDPTLRQQIARDIQFQTLLNARRPAPTTVRCPDPLRLTRGAVNTCTVTYRGLPVPWQVTITDNRGVSAEGRRVYLFTTTPDRYVIWADDIRNTWVNIVVGAYASAGTEMRCTRLPAVRTLPIGLTGDRCQYLDRNLVWQNFTVGVDRDGFIDFDQVQHG